MGTFDWSRSFSRSNRLSLYSKPLEHEVQEILGSIPSSRLRKPGPCLRSPDLVRAPRPSAIRRNARRRPRHSARCPRQPRQRPTSAARSCVRHCARQLKRKILNTFPTSPTISGCFVLECRCFVARIYCDGQYFYWAVRLVFGNKRGNY